TACGTEVVDDADLAQRATRVTDAATVPDQQMRKTGPVLARHESDEIAFDLHRVLLPREAEPLGQPAHVRVDDDPLRIAELGRDDVRRLARDAGQPHELLEPPRNLAVELL